MKQALSNSLRFLPANQFQEFSTRLRFIMQFTEHNAGSDIGILFFDAAHLHAKMARFNDDAHTFWFECFIEGISDLLSQAFLNL